jgi:uncharacterized protein (TIGR00730 family)
MAQQKGITVYCASSVRIDKKYFEAAEELGKKIAATGLPVINGAGRMGLMGAVNDSVLAAGGKAIGVIPQFMVDNGWQHTGLTEMHVVKTMHERKALMAELSCGAIALPGGIGTFEELMEIITWRKLGLYSGNVVIYNVDGYFDDLIAMLRHAIDEGFMHDEHLDDVTIVTDADAAVKAAIAPSEKMPLITEF